VNLKVLRKLRKILQEMRRSPQGRKAADLEAIAKQVGRKKDGRGKEPTYVRSRDPALSPPLSIPGHPGDLKPGTARSVIDTLLSDLDDWEIFLIGKDSDERIDEE
jgi:hypothetical protein